MVDIPCTLVSGSLSSLKIASSEWEHLDPHLTHGSLGQSEYQNGMSIGSAVFAKLTIVTVDL